MQERASLRWGGGRGKTRRHTGKLVGEPMTGMAPCAAGAHHMLSRRRRWGAGRAGDLSPRISGAPRVACTALQGSTDSQSSRGGAAPPLPRPPALLQLPSPEEAAEACVCGRTQRQRDLARSAQASASWQGRRCEGGGRALERNGGPLGGRGRRAGQVEALAQAVARQAKRGTAAAKGFWKEEGGRRGSGGPEPERTQLEGPEGGKLRDGSAEQAAGERRRACPRRQAIRSQALTRQRRPRGSRVQHPRHAAPRLPGQERGEGQRRCAACSWEIGDSWECTDSCAVAALTRWCWRAVNAAGGGGWGRLMAALGLADGPARRGGQQQGSQRRQSSCSSEVE